MTRRFPWRRIRPAVRISRSSWLRLHACCLQPQNPPPRLLLETRSPARLMRSDSAIRDRQTHRQRWRARTEPERTSRPHARRNMPSRCRCVSLCALQVLQTRPRFTPFHLLVTRRANRDREQFPNQVRQPKARADRRHRVRKAPAAQARRVIATASVRHVLRALCCHVLLIHRRHRLTTLSWTASTPPHSLHCRYAKPVALWVNHARHRCATNRISAARWRWFWQASHPLRRARQRHRPPTHSAVASTFPCLSASCRQLRHAPTLLAWRKHATAPTPWLAARRSSLF